MQQLELTAGKVLLFLRFKTFLSGRKLSLNQAKFERVRDGTGDL